MNIALFGNVNYIRQAAIIRESNVCSMGYGLLHGLTITTYARNNVLDSITLDTIDYIVLNDTDEVTARVINAIMFKLLCCLT